MKAQVYSIEGKKNGEVTLPLIFSSKIRQDVVQRCFESMKFIQPYSPDPRAGRKHSASGTISHKRHDWKGHYGKGISRVPRKTMWRRGTQFYWIGAEISGTRGGRKAHSPKGIGRERKINKKEVEMAINSAFAATADKKLIIGRYSSISDIKTDFPVIVKYENNMKTKKVKELLSNLFEDRLDIVFKNKEVRAGKGKNRGRKYKSNAGILFVKASDEKVKISGIDVKSISEVKISDLYPLGRITVYTEKAIAEMEAKK